MIHVLETWHIKEEFLDSVPELMQQMDDIVGPAAHDHPGFSGHATFLRDEDADPCKVWLLYQWRSREDADDLLAGEDELIAPFVAKYCRAPREITYLSEIPHTHDMEDHEHAHAHA